MGEYWPRTCTGDLWSSGNGMFCIIIWMIVNASTYINKNVLSRTLRIWVRVNTLLMYVLYLNFFFYLVRVSCSERESVSLPTRHILLQCHSYLFNLKIIWALTSEERALWNSGMKRLTFVRINRSGQARGSDTRSRHWMINSRRENWSWSINSLEFRCFFAPLFCWIVSPWVCLFSLSSRHWEEVEIPLLIINRNKLLSSF